MADRFVPSVFISVHSRFPTKVTHLQEACHDRLGRTVDKPPTHERIEGRTGRLPGAGRVSHEMIRGDLLEGQRDQLAPVTSLRVGSEIERAVDQGRQRASDIVGDIAAIEFHISLRCRSQ